MTLRVGITATPTSAAGVELVRQAERVGVDSVWVPEFWAGDALTPLAFLAGQTSTIRLATGIVQLGARTPAMLAMSAMSLQALSGGRFVLGIGSSGPQVMEGWHGVPFDKPVRRTRETIDIIRTVTAGRRLEYDGEIYRLPLAGGEGRAIRSLMPTTHVPIYEVSLDPIRQGASRAGRTLADLDLTVSVGVEFTDDVDAAGRRHAEGYAFTFGAMGSAGTNFYVDAFARQGHGEDVRE